jgi:type I restriction enzyme S subunit
MGWGMSKEWTLAENDAQGKWTLPNGWALVGFDEAITVVSTTGKKVKQREYLPSGALPVIDQGQEVIGGYTNDIERQVECELPVIIFGDHTRAFKFVDFSFVAGADGVKVLKPIEAFYSRLLFYFLQALDLPDRGYSRHFQFLRKETLPVPPLPEQRRIVAEIETQFTRLDAAVAALERVQANLRRYKAAVLKAACEGRLVPTEAELARVGAHRDAPLPYEPADQLLARILAERRARWQAEHPGKKYKEPASPDTESLPELPEGWAWATVEQLASPEPRSIQSGPFGSTLLHSEFQDSGVLAIGIDNVIEGQFSMGKQHRISPEKYEQLKKYTARPLDVLITVMATVGRCCVVPANLETAIVTKHVYRISANQRFVNPSYLMFALWGGHEVRRQLFGSVRGQTRPGINGKILRQIAIPIPPLPEQGRIVAEVERRLSLVAALEASVEAALARGGRLQQAVLKQAFEGRLVPQDPDDEPASVLLERIKAERAQQGRGSDRKAQPKQMELF